MASETFEERRRSITIAELLALTPEQIRLREERRRLMAQKCPSEPSGAPQTAPAPPEGPDAS